MKNLNETFGMNDYQTSMEVQNVVIQDSLPEEDADFVYSRNNYYHLIEQGKAAINTAMLVAAESQEPRALEVLGTLIKQMSEVNKQLVQMSKDRQEVKIAKRQVMPSDAGKQLLTENNGIVIKASDMNRILKERVVK